MYGCALNFGQCYTWHEVPQDDQETRGETVMEPHDGAHENEQERVTRIGAVRFQSYRNRHWQH
jgi:hypothetical protein